MKRIGKLLILATLLTVVLLAGCRAPFLSLAAFYDSADQLTLIYHIDQDGQLYGLDSDTGEWEPDGAPCTGTPPYDLSGWHDPYTDSWMVVAVDGEGTLWHSTDEWYQITEPLGIRGSYAISGFHDIALGDNVINIMDPTGQLQNYVGDGWGTIGTPCPGDGPYDLITFYDYNDDLYWLSSVNGAGKTYDLITGEWVQDGTPITGGPYRISGFHDIIADTYLLYVLDGAGNLYQWIGSDWEKMEVGCPGAAPFDLDSFYDLDTDSYYVLVLDSTGNVYLFTGEDWLPQN